MKRRIVKSGPHLAVAIALAASAALARAADGGTLELSIGTGYSRGIGPVSGGMPALQHLAGDGAALRVDVGWRLDPRWNLGLWGEGSLFASGHTAAVDGTSGVAGGVQARFHLAPLRKHDPWIALGCGVRRMAVDHGDMGTHSLVGLDLARLQVGVDHRFSRRVSLAPTVGVGLTEFLWEKAPGAGGYSSLDDRKLGAFVFAGVSGRVDLLGRSSTRG